MKSVQSGTRRTLYWGFEQSLIHIGPLRLSKREKRAVDQDGLKPIIPRRSQYLTIYLFFSHVWGIGLSIFTDDYIILWMPDCLYSTVDSCNIVLRIHHQSDQTDTVRRIVYVLSPISFYNLPYNALESKLETSHTIKAIQLIWALWVFQAT